MKKLLLLMAAIGCSLFKLLAQPEYHVLQDGIYYYVHYSNAYVVYCNRELTGDISIPSSITYNNWSRSVEKIDESAFSGCTGLTSITIPNSVTSIGQYAFSNCTGLTSVIVPINITSLGDYVFKNCSALTSVSFYANRLTGLPLGIFANCSSLTSVSIVQSISYIGEEAFKNCTGLTSITIPNSVTSIGQSAFEGCTNLKNISLGDGVRRIGKNAFYECSSLTSINIPIEPNSELVILEWAFANCSSLTSVTIGSGVTDRISEKAFKNCDNLTTITLNSYVSKSFTKEKNIVTIFGPQIKTCIIGDKKGVGAYAFSGSNISTVIVQDELTQIDTCAFFECKELTSVTYTLGSGVTKIGNSAFHSCISLTSITIPSQVSKILSGAFSECSQLDTVIIQSNTIINKEDLHYAFGNQIKTYILGDNITKIGNYAFRDCINLQDINFPNSVTEIGYNSFTGCEKLSSIYIPATITKIGYGAFSNCKMLSSIIVDEENTIYDSRDSCNAIIETATNKLLIGCKTSIIPDDVTRIALEAFSKCSLTSIIMPQNMNKIGDKAFGDCIRLRTITCHAIVPPDMGKTVFENVICKNIRLYVPAQSVEAYKAADQWKAFNVLAIGEDALPEILTDENMTDGKFMIDGVLYIRNNGRVYDLNGTIVE